MEAANLMRVLPEASGAASPERAAPRMHSCPASRQTLTQSMLRHNPRASQHQQSTSVPAPPIHERPSTTNPRASQHHQSTSVPAPPIHERPSTNNPRASQHQHLQTKALPQLWCLHSLVVLALSAESHGAITQRDAHRPMGQQGRLGSGYCAAVQHVVASV
jgi:hypothetical protein